MVDHGVIMASCLGGLDVYAMRLLAHTNYNSTRHRPTGGPTPALGALRSVVSMPRLRSQSGGDWRSTQSAKRLHAPFMAEYRSVLRRLYCATVTLAVLRNS